jgi:pilus assembly protein CpaB
MVGIAVAVGGVTVVGGRYYLERNARKPVAVAPVQPQIAMGTVVVAAQPLRFGMELSSQQLKEAPWPEAAIPEGATRTIAEMLKGPERRVVIAPMEANEPVLTAKITGPGQRAILSSILSPGMTAVSIPLNETQGVAGLVMPGDRVNVMLTRTLADERSYTDLLLQDVRVMAIDQVIDQRSEKPSSIRSATLEVMPQDAKRIALAGTMGSMSLMLRRAGEQAAGALGRVGVKDLLSASEADTTASHGKRTSTVTVTRNGKTEDYTVLTDRQR